MGVQLGRSDNVAEKDLRFRIRHSASHVMADAVLTLFPDATFAIGPPTEDGFYYDFGIARPFTPDDLESIDALMRDRIKADLPFVRSELSRSSALTLFGNQPFKQEIANDIPDGQAISTYQHGDFIDLCEGPHVERTGQIVAFKLLSVAGAYWRGDENKPMLQRIYGTAFESVVELDNHLANLEEATRRDHRKLGRELELFLFDPIAPASPFFLPKGTTLYNILTAYIRDLYKIHGYQEVITPQIFAADLWRRSGHYDNYRDNMYFTYVDGREFGVKPMNCPAHALMYAAQLHSYRDLPIRYADFGRLHRYERSGVTHGLTRVRTFTQDDAHIFCRPDQIKQEVAAFIDMLLESYKLFDFQPPRVMLSLRPEKRLGSDSIWDYAEESLHSVLHDKGIKYDSQPGEGAFYGPKIDFFVPDALRREWQLGTIQLDFSLPDRFDLKYVDEDGEHKQPVILHRAMLGTLERFIGVLIEHYGGAFPLWLAPIQVMLIPIADRHLEYTQTVYDLLENQGVRVQIDTRRERMNSKVRDAQLQKVPIMCIVGDREISTDEVSVRLRDGTDLGPLGLPSLTQLIRDEMPSYK